MLLHGTRVRLPGRAGSIASSACRHQHRQSVNIGKPRRTFRIAAVEENDNGAGWRCLLTRAECLLTRAAPGTRPIAAKCREAFRNQRHVSSR